MTRLSRENFLITGFVCILFGASMSVAGLGPMAVTVGLFGIVFFLVGMTLGRQSGLSPDAIAQWQPDGERLPEAGRFMYRVDVTLDEPHQDVDPVRRVRSRRGSRWFSTFGVHLSFMLHVAVGRRGVKPRLRSRVNGDFKTRLRLAVAWVPPIC